MKTFHRGGPIVYTLHLDSRFGKFLNVKRYKMEGIIKTIVIPFERKRAN
jgi:hypothetical protein